MKNITVPGGELAGLFKFEALKVDADGNEIAGSRRLLADWFPNLITDNGLELIGSSNAYLQYCQVGSGSATPVVADTALASRIAGTSTVNATAGGVQASAPYFAYRRNTYRFAEGVAAGNIAEVGVGAASTGNLLSRALILDGGGSPTVITVLSDEVLDVTYEIRCYAPTVDWGATVTISGVDYAIVGRASNVTNSGSWSITQIGVNNQASLPTVYNGAIGAITSVPSGSSGSSSTVTTASYSAGTHRKDATVGWALGTGNLAGGISAIQIKFGIGNYQFGITPAIPKNATTVLDLTFRNSWARKTL